MVKKMITLKNETGIHARPATELAKIAMKYPCQITLNANGKSINAKSPLMLMSAGIESKTEIEIVCEGESEDMALEEMAQAFENKFGEE